MEKVKVVKTGRTLYLIGKVKKTDESVASENPSIVYRIRRHELRDAVINLTISGRGEILAFEQGQMLGFVAWDEATKAKKLPVFMRRLLGVEP
jgi:hypothetical protein